MIAIYLVMSILIFLSFKSYFNEFNPILLLICSMFWLPITMLLMGTLVFTMFIDKNEYYRKEYNSPFENDGF